MMQVMKAAAILGLVLTLVLIAGCATKNNGDDGSGGPDLGVLGGLKNSLEAKKELANKVRSDDWAWDGTAAPDSFQPLSTPVEERTPITITFEESEVREENFESYTGGSMVDFAKATIEGDAPEYMQKIVTDHNAWVEERTKQELAAGKERWDLYHKIDPDSFICLNDDVGMKVLRSDTGLISYYTEVYRYNREYEKDFYEFHGYTYDPVSGRKLELSDFVTDPSALAPRIGEAIESYLTGSGYKPGTHYTEEGFVNRIRESIEGRRDDGLFAWAVDPKGFLFVLADPFYQDGYLMHALEFAYIPFESVSDLLRGDAYMTDYDTVTFVPNWAVEQIYHASPKLPEEIERWYSSYAVHFGGQEYLYVSAGDEGTLVYRFDGSKFEYVNSIIGKIDAKIPYFNTDPSIALIDPKRLALRKEASLIRELDLLTTASIGDDGVPVLNDLFHAEYNVEPMSVLEPFEAEIFTDEQDETPEKSMLQENDWLNFVRSDGVTFIDMEIDRYDDEEGSAGICRFYVEGDSESGWKVNGHPASEVLNLQGYFEE